MGPKMERGGGEGEGEERPTLRKRGAHCTHLSGHHMPFLPAPPQSPLSQQSPHPPSPPINLPVSGSLPQDSLRQNVQALMHLPTPAGRGWKEETSLPVISLMVGETFREGRPWTHPRWVSLPLPLLRMCLPDLLCPRFSPEGPERPARTEDASRGESRICRARGLRRALEGAGVSPPS